MIVKNGRKVDFYTSVVATTPEDSSSRRRIWRYSERSFPSMCTAPSRGFFTSGCHSRGRRSDLLKLPNKNYFYVIFFTYKQIKTKLITIRKLESWMVLSQLNNNIPPAPCPGILQGISLPCNLKFNIFVWLFLLLSSSVQARFTRMRYGNVKQ